MAKKKKEEIIETPYSSEIGGELQTSGGVNDSPIYNELVKQIFDVNNIAVKTDLSQNEIIGLACLDVYAQQFQNSLIKKFRIAYMELKLSHKRKSRGELVQIFRTISSSQNQTETGGLSRALGFGKES
jgi:hypothetical protein